MRTIVVDPELPDPGTLEPAADMLRAGGLVAFPTETVYGLGALAFDPAAVLRIFEAKGRPSDDPLIIHVRTEWDLAGIFAEVTPLMQRLIDEHWPGPLTIVAAKNSAVPDIVTAGRPTVAVRAPNHPVASLLLDLVGAPVAAPSANRFSYVSPTDASHVASDLGHAIDILVDGGPTPVGIESTIVGVDGDLLTVLRPGSVDVEEAMVGIDAPASVAPGRLDVHYSPRTPTRGLAAGGTLSDSGPGIFIGYDDSNATSAGWEVVRLGTRSDLESVARRLYRVLRAVDASEPREIVIEHTGLPGLGRAIDDRIRRSAGGRSVD
jgi:L-threonylcarbamoyladenylate synthase